MRPKPNALRIEFIDTMTEIRRELATLWFTGRDQASEEPAFDWLSSRQNIDNAAAELSMQLSTIEDLFRKLSECTETEAAK